MLIICGVLTAVQLEAIITATGIVPTVNQIERHPLCKDDELVAYCKEQKIHITAYSVSSNTRILSAQFADGGPHEGFRK